MADQQKANLHQRCRKHVREEETGEPDVIDQSNQFVYICRRGRQANSHHLLLLEVENSLISTTKVPRQELLLTSGKTSRAPN